MNTNYLCKHTDLEEKYAAFLRELDNQISQAGTALLQTADEPSFQINLEEDGLLVGEFETLLNGYPALDSILIEKGIILVRVELYEGYRLFEGFTSFSITDKLAILKVIESQINEF
jgi:hypothetical protein